MKRFTLYADEDFEVVAGMIEITEDHATLTRLAWDRAPQSLDVGECARATYQKRTGPPEHYRLVRVE